MSPQQRAWVLVVLVQVLNLGFLNADMKYWNYNTNFENPENWDSQRAPCGRDRVIFPADASISVFVVGDVAAKEIYLPLNGELILSVTAEIKLGGDDDSSCKGSDIHFTRDELRYWYDPANWMINDEWGKLDVNTLTQSTNNPVPSALRVPCAYDDVVFPPNNSFNVWLEDPWIDMGHLHINGKDLNSEGLVNFFASESGRKQFKSSTSVSVYGQDCPRPLGCTCGNEEEPKLHHICGYVDGHCPALHCTDHISPVGSCCPFCGSMLTMSLQSHFEFVKFKKYVGTLIEEQVMMGLAAYMYRIRDGVQIVLSSNEPVRAMSFAKKLEEELTKPIKQRVYGIANVKLERSQNWFSGPSPYTGHGLSSGSMAALIIGLLSVTIIAILFYIQRRKLMPLAFSFGRLENDEDRFLHGGALEVGVEMTQAALGRERGKGQAAAAAETEDSSIKGFDNPFYDPKCTDPGGFGGMSVRYKVTDSRENPCYLAFERVEDIPSTVDLGDSSQETKATKSPPEDH